MIDLVKEIALLQKQVDGLIKPEVPLGMSLISETVFAASAVSVTFSSIPQGFRYLVLLFAARTDRVAEVDTALLRFNGDSSASYGSQSLVGNSATASATAARGATSISVATTEAASSRASTNGPGIIFIFDYARAFEKRVISMSGAFGDMSADADLFLVVRNGYWQNTIAITSLALLPSLGTNFVTGSRFSLYGVM